MRSIRLFHILIALAVMPGAAFGVTAGDLLRRSEDADKRVSYRGIKTATVRFGNRVAAATMKVVHLKPSKTRKVYFAPTFLAGTVIIEDGNQFWRFRPQEEAWEPIRCARPCEPDVIRREALRNFEVRLIGTEEVAGRTAYVIHAVPKYRGEAAHRMWVDREYSLVVGTQTESQSGSVLTSSRYVSLQMNPDDIDPSIFEIRGKSKPATKTGGAKDLKVKRPSYVPVGYRLVATTSMWVNGCTCVHAQYSNGVNIISIFQHKSCGQAPPELQRIAGKTTNILTWARDGMQFTIIGDLPRPELQRIANSVK